MNWLSIQRRFDWVNNVGIVYGGVKLRALKLNIRQVATQAAIHDFLDRGITKHGTQAARQPVHTDALALLGGIGNRGERGFKLADSEADRVRELIVEQQKFQQAARMHIGAVDFAIG